jgi:DNA-binding transcriptional LysR family regulator
MAKDAQTDEVLRTAGSLPPGELAAFLAVAENGGFRSAARTMDQSASALSHAVAGLERRLKVKLFHRSTRNVSLTEAGQRFFSRLMPAISEIGKAVEELTDMSAGPSGLIRINTDATAAEQVLIPLLAEFIRSHPEIRIEVVTEKRLVDIAEGGFDCGVRLAELVSEEMIAIPIGLEQQHIIIGSASYLDSSPPLERPSDLARHRCIQLRMPTGAIYRWEFSKRNEALTIPVEGPVTVDNSRLLLEMAKQGCGLAYLTKGMASDALSAGIVRQVLSDWTPPYPGLCLYYPKHRHISGSMRAFVEFLRATRREG